MGGLCFGGEKGEVSRSRAQVENEGNKENHSETFGSNELMYWSLPSGGFRKDFENEGNLGGISVDLRECSPWGFYVFFWLFWTCCAGVLEASMWGFHAKTLENRGYPS